MKKVFALVLIAALLLMPAAFAQESLTGSWELDVEWVLEKVAEAYGLPADQTRTLLEQAGMDINDLIDESSNMELVFSEDGTGKVLYAGESMEFTYFASGNSLFVQAIGGEQEQWSYALVDGKLDLAIPDAGEYKEMTFVRKQGSLVGTWKIDEDWFLELTAASAGMTVEETKKALELVGVDINDLTGMVTYTFEADGTGTGTVEGETQTFTYQVDGNNLTIFSNGVKEVAEFTITNGKLTITMDGVTMVMAK